MTEDITAFIADLTTSDLSRSGLHGVCEKIEGAIERKGILHTALQDDDHIWFEIYDWSSLWGAYANFKPHPHVLLCFSLQDSTFYNIRAGLKEHLHHLGNDVWLGDRVAAILSVDLSRGREWVRLRLVATNTAGRAKD